MNAHRVAVARELRMDRRALDKVNAELSANPYKLRWLTARYPNQFRIALQALHWIEFDENTDRTDTARVLNDEAAADAVAVVGTPYTWEGATPSAGFDSSGLAKWVWGRQGIVLPHNAAMQYYMASSRGQVVDNGPSMDVTGWRSAISCSSTRWGTSPSTLATDTWSMLRIRARSSSLSASSTPVASARRITGQPASAAEGFSSDSESSQPVAIRSLAVGLHEHSRTHASLGRCPGHAHPDLRYRHELGSRVDDQGKRVHGGHRNPRARKLSPEHHG